jgi:hypothetical protein
MHATFADAQKPNENKAMEMNCKSKMKAALAIVGQLGPES